MRQPFLLVLLFVLAVSGVAAIGISPPNANLEYEPGKVYQFNVRVFNYNDFPIALDARTTGPLEHAIQVRVPQYIPAEGAADIPVTITIPMTRDRPGHEKSYLYFKERYVEEMQGTFSVRTEVGLTIDVWQPYPGLYAEIAAAAESVSEGSDTELDVYINNLGTDSISAGTAVVRVVSATGTVKDSFTFSPVDVAGNSNKQYTRVIPSSGYEPGKYLIEATLQYGGKTASMNGSFIVGKQDVEVLAVEGPFYLDKPVNRFTVTVESLWNQPLDPVYAVFTLGSHSTQTPSQLLNPFSKGQLTNYWETDVTLPPGQANATVQLFFPGGQKNVTVPVTIVAESPKVVVEEQEPTVVLTVADIIFAVIAIIIVVCIILFAWQRHKKPPLEAPPAP